jgi:hypothetical protein
MCVKCTELLFPFNHISDNAEFTNTLLEDCSPNTPETYDKFNYDDFNPFDWNDNNLNEPLFDRNPDMQFYNDTSLMQNLSNCNYYLTDKFHKTTEDLSIDDGAFSLFHLNIRSSSKNFSELESFLEVIQFKFTVIGITESWLSDTNADCFGIEGYQHIYACRKHRRGGGLSMYIQNGYTVNCRHDLDIMNESLEVMFVELLKGETGLEKNAIIGLVYRPPNQDVNIFVDTITEKLSQVRNEHKIMFLMGDFNVNILNHEEHIPTSEFLECMYSNSMFPLISKPTRITKDTATLIDNIFVTSNYVESSILNGMFVTQISDHLPVFTICYKNKVNTRSQSYENRHITSQNLNKFIEKLRFTDWSDICNNLDGPSAFNSFYSLFRKIYDECFPIKTLIIKDNYKNRKPWLSDGMKDSIKLKNLLYLKQLKSPTEKNIKEYKNYKNYLSKILRSAERNYYDSIIQQNKNNSKKLWSVMKQVIGKGKSSKLPSQFKFENRLESNEEIIANTFNRYFVNIGNNLAKKIPATNVDPLSYIKSNNLHSIYLKDVESNEVKRVILNLKNSCPGFDGITAEVIKKTYKYYLTPLIHVLKLSFTQGFFPDYLKQARVVPIFKSGDVMSISNYRPVSILPVFSKIFERLMYDRLISFLEKHSILYDYQFGFRQHYSTAMAVTTLTDKILSAIDNSQIVIGVFLDFQKAFDTVNHNILLKKLAKYGIRGTALKWLECYLCKRMQFVSYGVVNSSSESVSCGVPQGSILGPLLFLLYINDIVNVSSVLTPIVYADDTNVFIKGSSIDIMAKTLNEELSKLFLWLTCNKLSLNVNKTHYMIFKTRNRRIGTFDDIIINSNMIDRVESTKFVGVMIDAEMKWESHIKYVKSKVAKGIGIISKARKSLPRSSLITLYYTMIYPYLTYCIEAWGNAAQIHVSSLYKLQKRAIRVITSSSYHAHTDPLFKNLGILKLCHIYTSCICIFIFKFIKGMLPMIFNNIFCQNLHTGHRVTRNEYKLHLPLCKTSLYRNSIKYQGPVVWNNFGDLIDHCCSIHTFKKRIKKQLVHNQT